MPRDIRNKTADHVKARRKADDGTRTRSPLLGRQMRLPVALHQRMRLCAIQTAQVAESNRSHRKHRHEMLSPHAILKNGTPQPELHRGRRSRKAPFIHCVVRLTQRAHIADTVRAAFTGRALERRTERDEKPKTARSAGVSLIWAKEPALNDREAQSREEVEEPRFTPPLSV